MLHSVATPFKSDIWLLLKHYKTKEFEQCFCPYLKINISDIRLIPLDHVIFDSFTEAIQSLRPVMLWYLWGAKWSIYSSTIWKSVLAVSYRRSIYILKCEIVPSVIDARCFYQGKIPTCMWHDQEEWVGCRRYCFWDIGKNSVQILLFYIVF